MNKEHEELLERQTIIEKRIDQMEEQLELVSELLEKITGQMQIINEAISEPPNACPPFFA